MEISILTVVLNRSNEIKDSLESLKRQTFKNIEHIIIDGGSTDGTLDILKEYVNSINKFKTVLISEKDKGLYNALNKGIKLARGNIVGVLHAGDLFYDELVLERINKEFEENPKLDVVYGDVLFFNAKGKIVRVSKPGKFSKEKILKYGWHPIHTAMFIKKDIYDKFGLYREDFDISSDYEYMIRILLKGNLKVKYLSKFLVKMKTGGKSGNAPRKLIKKLWEDYRIIKKYKLPFYTVLMKRFYKLKEFINV